MFTLSAADPDGGGPCLSVFDNVNVVVKDTAELFFNWNPVGPYAENQPPVILLPNRTGGVFSGPGIIFGGGNNFYPNFANVGMLNTVTYSFIDPVTGCSSIYSDDVIVNPVTDVDFQLDPAKVPRPGTIANEFICAAIGDVELFGDPLVSSAPVPPISADFTSLGIIKQSGFQFFIDTDKMDSLASLPVPVTNFYVTYTYVNELSAPNSIIKEIILYSTPRAVILAPNACIGNLIQFDGLASDIPKNYSSANFDFNSFIWDFDDNTPLQIATQPSYLYTVSQFYNVSLTVTTDQNCSNTVIKPIQVGRPPTVDFSWSKVCSGDVTEFINKSKTGISKADSVRWDFGDGSPALAKKPLTAADTTMVNTPWNPYHSFPSALAYDITLTVETEEGCAASLTKNAFILTTGSAQTVAATGYREDFRLGQGTWFPTNTNFENVTITDWLFGAPDGTVINNAIDNAWYMRDYKNDANFVMIGPCLDLSQLARPMISLDFWVDTDEQLDGAVVQYSTAEGVDGSWQTIGDDEKTGINWYNNSPITGNPGEQTFGQFGWSGQSLGWVTARFNLDEIDPLERDKVVFRIAFGANNPTTTRTFNGFAFDNIFIGEKTKTVLVEHFTNNADQTAVLRNTRIDNDFDTQTIVKGASDFIKLQYHVSNPGADGYNANNPADPGARSVFYGVQDPPFTIMNGLVGNYQTGNFNTLEINYDGDYPFHSNTSDISSAEIIDIEALRSPKFDIDLVLDGNPLTVTDNKIDYDITITYADSINTTFSNPVVIHIALYEEVATDGGLAVRNVHRKMLTSSGGVTVTQNSPPWTWNGSASTNARREGSADLDIQFQNSANLFVVAFVQDKNTREIYQVLKQKVNGTKIPEIILGVDDNSMKTELEGIEMYPNPASKKVNLYTEGILSQRYTWKIITQQGTEVLSGNLEREFFEPKEIDTDKLSDGIYFMVLGSHDKPFIYKKLAIVNRN